MITVVQTLRERHEMAGPTATGARRGPGEGSSHMAHRVFRRPRRTMQLPSKLQMAHATDPLSAWFGRDAARGLSTLQSDLLAPNARALFRFKLSVVEMKMRLDEDH